MLALVWQFEPGCGFSMIPMCSQGTVGDRCCGGRDPGVGPGGHESGFKSKQADGVQGWP